jgi:hypothetical protein
MRRLGTVLALATLTAASAAAAQEGSAPADGCASVGDAVRASCLVAAQGASSAQAWMAMVVAGGNPTPGAASAAGLHLGVLSGVGVSLTASGVVGHQPELREARIEPTDAVRFGRITAVAPAISGTATLEVTRGISTAPTVGGIGSLELLGTVGWAASPAPDGDFGGGSSALSYGGGARLGLLRESFGVPGVALSVLYHRLGRVRSGRVCSSGLGSVSAAPDGLEVEQGLCTDLDPGDIGAYSFDLGSWSARGVVAKHLLGLGLAAGLGYDRASSRVDLAARTTPGGFATPSREYARIRDARLTQGRWTGFVDGSFSVLVASVAAEAGWLSGGDPVAGYPASSSDFDPRHGTFYGSLGVRVAL